MEGYGTPQRGEDKARVAAEIIANFQASCDRTMEKLGNLSRTPTQVNGRDRSCSPSPKYGRARSQPACPPALSGDASLVKSNLDAVMKIVSFGRNEFMDERFARSEGLAYLICRVKDYLAQGARFIDDFEPLTKEEFQTLPQLIEVWKCYSKEIQDMYDSSVDPECPSPNISAMNHPSREISQKAYTEMLRSGNSLCLEVERGLRVVEIMYSKLDEFLCNELRRMEESYNSFSEFEETINQLVCDSKDWCKRFKDLDYGLCTFFEEWENGEDCLNQPTQSTPPPPQTVCIPPPNFGNFRTATCPAAEIDRGKECKSGPVKDKKGKGLEIMIERFNTMNSTLHQEAQLNMDQREVLNQSLKVMEELPQNKEDSDSTKDPIAVPTV